LEIDLAQPLGIRDVSQFLAMRHSAIKSFVEPSIQDPLANVI
jgi:hypothetical protein